MIECYTDSLSLFLPLSLSLSLAHLHRTNGRRREEKVQFATHLLQLLFFFLVFDFFQLLFFQTFCSPVLCWVDSVSTAVCETCTANNGRGKVIDVSLTLYLFGELLHVLLVSRCHGLCRRPLGAFLTIFHRLDHRLHPGGRDERTAGKDDKVGNVLVVRHVEVVNGYTSMYNNTVSAQRRHHELITYMLLL